MPTLRILATALVIALPLSACGPGIDGPAESAPLAGDEVRVEVTNHNWSDMAVYVVRSGARHRLGMVTSMQTQTFELPSTVASSTAAKVRFEADPIGSTESYTTQPVQVWPGGTVEFSIENLITTSSLMTSGM